MVFAVVLAGVVVAFVVPFVFDDLNEFVFAGSGLRFADEERRAGEGGNGENEQEFFHNGLGWRPGIFRGNWWD